MTFSKFLLGSFTFLLVGIITIPLSTSLNAADGSGTLNIEVLEGVSADQKADLDKTAHELCYSKKTGEDGGNYFYYEQGFTVNGKPDVEFEMTIECYTPEIVCPWDSNKESGVKFLINSSHYTLYVGSDNIFSRTMKIIKNAVIENSFTIESDKVNDGDYFVKTREGHSIPIKVKEGGLFEVNINNGDKILILYSPNLNPLGNLSFGEGPYTSKKYQEVNFVAKETSGNGGLSREFDRLILSENGIMDTSTADGFETIVNSLIQGNYKFRAVGQPGNIPVSGTVNIDVGPSSDTKNFGDTIILNGYNHKFAIEYVNLDPNIVDTVTVYLEEVTER
jgi:hypothetical protein